VSTRSYDATTRLVTLTMDADWYRPRRRPPSVQTGESHSLRMIRLTVTALSGEIMIVSSTRN